MSKFLNAQGVAHLWQRILERINEIVVDPVEILTLSNEDIDAIIDGTYQDGGSSNPGGDFVG